MPSILRVAIIAVSLALDVFAVSIGVGVRGGLGVGERLRIGATFALAEIVMSSIGIGIGTLAGDAVGDIAAYVGFGALIAIGIYMVVEVKRDEGKALDLSHGVGLVLAALSVSLDSLGIGFSIKFLDVPIGWTLVAIAIASVTATSLGLAFGAAFGSRVGSSSGLLAGFALIATGGLFLALKLEGVAI